jgi:ribosomal-protein-alanine N-acetyltransferase
VSTAVRGLRRAVAVGPRVFLRAPAAADAEEFCATMQASRRHFARWGHPPYHPSAFRHWRRGRHGETVLRFLICRAADGAIMGQVSLGNIVRGLFQSAYTGYYLARPFTGQGYMTEALGLVLRHAFRDLRLHRVEANIQPENAPSIAVVRRCGFQREGLSPRMLKMGGRWRDHERWAILVEDWRAQASRVPGLPRVRASRRAGESRGTASHGRRRTGRPTRGA